MREHPKTITSKGDRFLRCFRGNVAVMTAYTDTVMRIIIGCPTVKSNGMNSVRLIK